MVSTLGQRQPWRQQSGPLGKESKYARVWGRRVAGFLLPPRLSLCGLPSGAGEDSRASVPPVVKVAGGEGSCVRANFAGRVQRVRGGSVQSHKRRTRPRQASCFPGCSFSESPSQQRGPALCVQKTLTRAKEATRAGTSIGSAGLQSAGNCSSRRVAETRCGALCVSRGLPFHGCLAFSCPRGPRVSDRVVGAERR